MSKIQYKEAYLMEIKEIYEKTQNLNVNSNFCVVIAYSGKNLDSSIYIAYEAILIYRNEKITDSFPSLREVQPWVDKKVGEEGTPVIPLNCQTY